MKHLLSPFAIGKETGRLLERLFDEPGFQDSHVTAFVAPPMMLLFHRIGIVETSVRTEDLTMSLDEFSERFLMPAAHQLKDLIWSERPL